MNDVIAGGRVRNGLVVLVVAIAALGLLAFNTAKANTGCPESTSNLGDINLSGTCTVDTDTTWENGTINITGNVVINAGVTLTLQTVTIRFDPGFDDEFGIEVHGSLSMQGGGAESTNTNKWDLITTPGSAVTIGGSDFANGHYDFAYAVADVGYSTFRDSDMSSGGQHLWLGPYSRFHHNVLQDISLAEDAAIVVYKNWGETSIWGNELHLNCYGGNCMGIEVVNMQEEETEVFPGFPVVEVAWNNVTWEDIGTGAWAISFDNEYSSRLWIHNNTQYVSTAGQAAGNCLQAGGVRRGSIFENNTCYGPTIYGVWDYIYSDTGNVFRYNYFEDVEYGLIFQVGTATVSHNTFVNVAQAPFWICPSGGGCAGSSSAVVGNVFYDNTVDYAPGARIARASQGNLFDNTLIQHGNGQATQWMESTSGPYHTVPGDGNWLYWADQDIEKLQFVNTVNGTRRVNMGVGGILYGSEYVGFGATDNASLTVEGLIDRRGSSNYDDSGSGTFLWSLGPQKTDIDVLATGDVTFTVEDFLEDTEYEVSVDGNLALTFTTDDLGFGSFTLNFASQHLVVIEGQGIAPPPPDGTPPAPVTDLTAEVVESDYVILRWTAPGDDGSVGLAATYDVRYSTAGPLNETNFGTAAPVPVVVPPPASGGSTERLNVTGLSPGTEYWFALRTADEVPNWSPVSNSVNATTLLNETNTDDTPPTVQITSPSESAFVKGTMVPVTVEAFDDTSVETVTILIDGGLATTLDEGPYEWSWSTAGVAVGLHILRAEAIDPSGNVGIDDMELTVISPDVPTSEAPIVESISYNATEGQFDIRFSKPMDRSTVEVALGITPQITYRTAWGDDANLTVILQEAAGPDTTYTLTIGKTAASFEGTTLTEAFTFTFTGSGATGDRLRFGDLWLQISMLLAGAWVVLLVFLFLSRKGVRQLRMNLRQLALQVEEMNNAPPEKIDVYHRY